jgi:thiamine biosynthesis lipoprotein ApbE
MDETKQNWVPWFIAAGAVFLLIRNQQPGQDTSKPAITAVVRTTLPTIREAYRSAFLEAAKKIEDGSIKDQEQWTKFIAENAGAKQREALDKVYRAIDELDLPASFVGKESEIAKLNRQIAEAW